MGLEPGSLDRKPVPGKALLPTDDFLGHGEQGQSGVRALSHSSSSPVTDSGLPWDLAATEGEGSFKTSQLGDRPRSWPHRGRKCRDQGWKRDSWIVPSVLKNV